MWRTCGWEAGAWDQKRVRPSVLNSFVESTPLPSFGIFEKREGDEVKGWNLRLTYRPTLSSRTEYALFRTAGLMRLVDPSASDGKAFLEFRGKIQMTQMTSDTAAAD